jgi:hypothetical protein
MIRKSLVVTLTFIVLSSAAFAQGGAGSGGGASSAGSGGVASGGSASSGNSAATTQSGAQSGQDKSGISTTTTGNNMSPAQRAQTGVDTRPQNEAPGAVSAPGVGIGHSENGLPIGSPGSGRGSPEDPVDIKKR